MNYIVLIILSSIFESLAKNLIGIILLVDNAFLKLFEKKLKYHLTSKNLIFKYLNY